MSNADIRGRFVWHELMTTDTDAAAAFYSKVVPWKTQDSGMPSYTLWMAGKTQVGGLTGLPTDGESGTPPHWIVYVATPDVDDTVAAAERLGGKVLKGPTDIPNMGRYAVLTDPQGATFAVYTPPGAPPEGADAANGGPGEFGWHELATTDQDAALSFYTELFGWEKGAAHDMGGMTYQLIQHNGVDVGGIFTLQAPATPPNWLSYVRVADCTKATNAAKSGGGRILNGPMEVPGGSWITQIMDPQGGAFAVMEAPKAAASKPAAKKSGGKAKATAKAAVPTAAPESEETAVAAEAPAPARAAAKKAPGKAAAKKAAKKAPGKVAAKAGGRKAVGKAKSGAGKKTAKKAAKKAPKTAAGKRPAKSTSARKTNGPAKRGKSAAKKAAKRPAKKAKRR